MNVESIRSKVGHNIRFIIFLFLSVAICSPRAWSTPPESLVVEYDLSTGALVIYGSHPTQDRLEHFIRRAVVVRNDDEPQKFYVTRQDSANGFKFNFPFKAEGGDQLQVEVFCSQGGSKTAAIQIPKAEPEAEPAELTAEDIKAIKDRDHQSIPVIP